MTLTNTGGAVLTLMLSRIQKTEELQIKTENKNLRLRKYKRCIFLILSYNVRTVFHNDKVNKSCARESQLVVALSF